MSRVTIVPEEDRLNAQIAFAIEIDKLKRIIRRNHLIDGSRRENTAEHSWYVGTLAMVLGEHAPPGTDLQRVVAMLLVHDLVEIDAGDTFIYDPVEVAAQAEVERAAADRIFGLLPAEQGGVAAGVVGRVRGAQDAGGALRQGARPVRPDPG
ncbi:hypothetical protein GCM10020001_050710 [Nonomuraea salmonea]